MEIIFKYGKCIFTRLSLANVDDMVEMMNSDRITSMLSTKKKIITREMVIKLMMYILVKKDNLSMSYNY